MFDKSWRRFLSASLLLLALTFVPLLPVASAQKAVPAQAVTAPEYAAQLAKIEEKLEKRRAELGIPGAALVIVRDDKIIYLKGLGYKNYEGKIAVTPDTQFAIGSATKAFTALGILLSQDEGKLSLDDSPKKYLPYFRINNPDTDANIKIRDLLAHSSGLGRTDLAMVAGKFNREELIRVVGEAKPVAKLREQFLYQNIMFAAAGEIVAQTQKQTWEQFTAKRILAPLGMSNSNFTVKAMQSAKDFSWGYEYNPDTKTTKRQPQREIGPSGPAGSINSSARDMANWLRFLMNGGTVDGKRLVSEAAFAEYIKPQMKIAGKISYGLGWFLRDWNGLKVVEHGGNIDGFNAQVAFVPEKKLGFVLLTNVTGSPLPGEMMPVVWENLLGKPEAVPPGNVKPEAEAGKYRFEAAGFDIEVKMDNGKLVAVVPGQPTYTLENVGGRKYKLAGAPDGFFLTFRDKDAYLEQPQGNYTLPKAGAESVATVTNAKDLAGLYESEAGGGPKIEVAEKDGKIALIVPGQPPYELRAKGPDLFNSPALPDSYGVKAKRGADGKVSGIVLLQPEGEVAFKRAGVKDALAKPQITVEELMPQVIAALGGAENWQKLKSRVSSFDIDFVNQGVKGYGTTSAQAPNMTSTKVTLTALGKPIGTLFDYFDGQAGGEGSSFSPFGPYTGKQLEDARIGADFYGLLNWRANYRKAEVRGMKKEGDEECYVVVFEPEKGNRDTFCFSAKTFLPLRQESFITAVTRGIELPFSETYSDYRTVDGVVLPFKSVNSNPGSGELVTTVKEIKHNVALPAGTFSAAKLKYGLK